MADDKPTPPPDTERPRPITPDPMVTQTHGQDPPDVKIMIQPDKGETRGG